MIFFKKIKWKNFLSTGNTFTEIALDSCKSTILIGQSGSGKSTLLDAIAFVLFNKPFRNITKAQLVNSINQKECLVEIEFTIGSKSYLIRRGIKPNVFEIYANGELVNQDSHNKDYQEFLEKSVLKFNFKTFSQIVVLGASNFIPFMQLKPSDRRVIIESLLDIEIFSVMNVVLKQELSTLKSALQDNEMQSHFESSKKELQEEHLKDLQKMKSETLKENENAIKSNQQTIEKLLSENSEHEEQVKTNSSDKQKKADLSKNIDKLNRVIDRLNDNIDSCASQISFYRSTTICSTCKQNITEDAKTKEISAINLKREEFVDALHKAKANSDKFSKQLDSMNKLDSIASSYQDKITKNNNTIQAIRHFIQKLESERNKLSEVKDDQQKYIDAIKQIEFKLSELENEKIRLLYEKGLTESAIILLKDDGVKAKIIKQYLPVINKHTNLYLNSMNFFVSFNIDEEFNECIKSRGRDVFSYENFSEGEKQRIDLALLLTWRTIAKLKNSINTNLLIMDEVLDSYLDNAATENVLFLLNSEMFNGTNIFVISHKETISDKFNRVITFSKNKNFSSIT